jgi:hypothetical protein
MKNFRAADKSHAGGDEKHDINFHWPIKPKINESKTSLYMQPHTRGYSTIWFCISK